MIGESWSRKLYLWINAALLLLFGCLCLLPVLHVLALSLSSGAATLSGKVGLWPVEFTFSNFTIVLGRQDFVNSFLMSLKRVALGIVVNMFFVVTMAYPLSKNPGQFHGRTLYAWFLMIAMLFSGGLIPTYIVMRELGLIDTIWALILPGAVPIWNVVLLMNFFRGLPKEIEESAFIDGAGHMCVMWQLYVPLSAPSIATIVLFTIVGHWNSWFDGMLYINKIEMYPLQTFLRMVNLAAQAEVTSGDSEFLRGISDRSVRSAQVFIAMLPVLCVYPFLQKHFTKGIVMGSVKG